jgi:hypothetical protein
VLAGKVTRQPRHKLGSFFRIRHQHLDDVLQAKPDRENNSNDNNGSGRN